MNGASKPERTRLLQSSMAIMSYDIMAYRRVDLLAMR